MRRFLGVLVLAVLAAGVLSGAALAKEMGVEFSSTPVGLEPGEPWTPELSVIFDSAESRVRAEPGVTIRNLDTGERTTFPASPTRFPNEFDVRVVFPEAGWYTVVAFDGVTGRSYPVGGQWLVGTPEAAPGPAAPAPADPVPAAGDEGQFPLWPVAAGGSVLLLLAAGAALLLRRQRLGLSH
jgi:hypothetical protein